MGHVIQKYIYTTWSTACIISKIEREKQKQASALQQPKRIGCVDIDATHPHTSAKNMHT